MPCLAGPLHQREAFMKAGVPLLAVTLGALLLSLSPVMADTHESFGQEKPAQVVPCEDPGHVHAAPAGRRTARNYSSWHASLFAGGVVLFGVVYSGVIEGSRETDDSTMAKLLVIDDEVPAGGAPGSTMFPKTGHGSSITALRHVKAIRVGLAGEAGRGLAYRSRF